MADDGETEETEPEADASEESEDGPLHATELEPEDDSTAPPER